MKLFTAKFSGIFAITASLCLMTMGASHASTSPATISTPKAHHTTTTSSASLATINNARRSELDEASDKMHSGMSIKYSANADYDFMRSMLAHHVGAVEMAQIELKYGQDEQVKKLAKNIIKSQNKEIKMMISWINAYEKANPQSIIPSIPNPTAPSKTPAPAPTTSKANPHTKH